MMTVETYTEKPKRKIKRKNNAGRKQDTKMLLVIFLALIILMSMGLSIFMLTSSVAVNTEINTSFVTPESISK